MLELPHTDGCLVCGKNNPQGLRLHLSVDAQSGQVRVPFTPRLEHIGFNGIVHGGMVATVLDEAMAWVAAWAARKFCVCAEMTVRFVQNVSVGQEVIATADVVSNRPRLIQTQSEIRDAGGNVLASGSGKYTPMSPENNRKMLETLIHEPHTLQAYKWLVAAKT